MNLSAEDSLVLRLANTLPPPLQTHLSIGDDAAAIMLPDGSIQLITTDVLMEDIHFRLKWNDLPALGWKALAQNLSDIAAMGGTPTHAVIAIALPPCWTADEATALYQGLAELAALSGTDIIGGDTIRSIGPLTITLTVLGRVSANELLTRSGAQPADAIFITGSLGRAAAGLHLLDADSSIPVHLLTAVQAQLRPQPRLQAGRALAASGNVTAMMDLSDGVATDLHRLCRMSQVGAVIEQTALPVDPVVCHACIWLNELGETCDPQQLALIGGEDFELLFTAPPHHEEELRTRLYPLPITRIGYITAATDLLLQQPDGQIPLPWGFTHF